MYAMRGNAHATFKFITLIFVIIVTMQEQTQKGKKQNGYTMHVMRIICG